MGGMLIAAFGGVFGGIGAADDFFQYVVPVFLMMLHLAMCLAISKSILRRVEELGAK
jgi:hypothetical protein